MAAPVPVSARRFSGRAGSRILLATALGGVVLVLLLVWESRTSELHGAAFSTLAAGANFELGEGPSPSVRFPGMGPYDQRLGYARIPHFAVRLRDRGFRIARQARLAPAHRFLVDMGVNPIYREKTRAGLRVEDARGAALHAVLYPHQTYNRFEAIPPLVVASILYLEDRELLDERYPRRDPAVEWDRLARAGASQALRTLGLSGSAPGGSTMATQLEKIRHSPGGRTESIAEKLRQMLSASLRAYRGGEDTLGARRELLVSYLDSLPLAAAPGHGEVTGLRDGMRVWFGAEPERVDALLFAPPVGEADPARLEETGRAYKRVLSLLYAGRRPSSYLRRGREALRDRTDAILRRLSADGIVAPELAEAALRSPLDFAEPAGARLAGVASRDPVRPFLGSWLGVLSSYELDRLDLVVESTLDAEAQRGVTRLLAELRNPAAARAHGLVGPRLLGSADASRVAYSVLVYERTPRGGRLRVDAQSPGQPFDLTSGSKLDLGSTAKLRTLATYLETVADLRARHLGLSPEKLRQLPVHRADVLTRWVVDVLARKPETTLPELLDMAMARRYSASPWESFFTGGGRHHFRNYDPEEDERIPTVREALRDSVNLVFVRLLREIVHHHIYGNPDSAALLEQDDHPRRAEYLDRFADREGRHLLARFYAKHRGRELPAAPPQVPSARPLDLADRAFLARKHPLELFVVELLREHPLATSDEVLAESEGARRIAYRWLSRSRRRNVRDSRIRTILEEEAFREIHLHWQQLGYPFDSLVPSYATSIGASADRPTALAELMGIIANSGMRAPAQRVERLRFAEGTPYETALWWQPGPGELVMRPEVASVLREALVDTVERGTARRAFRSLLRASGEAYGVGGKTGTGDHRFKVFARGGRLIDSRAVSRAATFAFLIEDRYYGVVTAAVMGPDAAHYRFTSALAVQLFRELAPALEPLLREADESAGPPRV